MRYYVLIASHACEYPEVNTPCVFIDRVKAIDAWRSCVLEALGYPDDEVDPEYIIDVGTAADEFLSDSEKTEIGWVVNFKSSLEEMVHAQLFSVEEHA